MRTNPTPISRTDRHHRLKGELAVGAHGGVKMDRWQIEVTGAGRVWYLVEAERRTVWIDYASTRHPRATDR
jgi:hypothetical protein